MLLLGVLVRGWSSLPSLIRKANRGTMSTAEVVDGETASVTTICYGF